MAPGRKVGGMGIGSRSEEVRRSVSLLSRWARIETWHFVEEASSTPVPALDRNFDPMGAVCCFFLSWGCCGCGNVGSVRLIC